MKRRISRLNQKIAKQESSSKKPVRIPKRNLKTTIRFKISSGNLEKDVQILSQTILVLHRLAKKHDLKLRYQVKEGCLDIILDVLLPLGISLGSMIFYDFIKSAIRKLQESPAVEVIEVPSHYKEARAKEMHKELHRSYKGIVSRKSIESDKRKGTQFKIRDKNNMDWSYDIFDNGDEFSHD